MLRGDSTKAHAQLGWRASTTLSQLMGMMVDADIARQGRSA
jgi:GDP-D-mannose dehydratase